MDIIPIVDDHAGGKSTCGGTMTLLGVIFRQSSNLAESGRPLT